MKQECRRCKRYWGGTNRPPSGDECYFTARGYCNAECMAADFDNWRNGQAVEDAYRRGYSEGFQVGLTIGETVG